MRQKVVIIGSGLGGLSAGAILARAGYDVTVIERHSVAGGCLQCFSRNGTRFETGMHFVGAVEPGQILHRILTLCGVADDVKFSRLNPDGYNVISLAGRRFRYAAGREAFIDTLAADIGGHQKEIAAAFDLMRSCARSSSLYTSRSETDAAFLASEYHLTSIGDVFRSLGVNGLLRDVMGGDLSLYAGNIDTTPFSAMAFLKEFYSDGGYRFVGGSSTLADALVKVIRQCGGEVYTRREAIRIECGAARADAVVTNTGERFEADYILSDIHPSALMPLLDTPLLRPAYRQRMLSLENVISAFTVYLTFHEGALRYMDSNLFGYTHPTPWGCEDFTGTRWPGGYLYMHHADTDENGYARCGQIISYMRFAEVEKWAHTRLGNRPEEYHLFKKERAERLIDAVEKDVPGLRKAIKAINVSTPLTYRDYTGTPQGSMYGVSKNLLLGTSNRVSYKTRIPNLFLIGQNINSHGMLGVLVGTLVSCAELPGLNDIFKRLYHE